MKTIKIKSIFSIILVAATVLSCKQDLINLQQAKTVAPSKGTTDFTTYVSLGNSLTAGYQAGALFTAGQNNSFPKILAAQFSLAQGTSLTFNQPDINSVNGYNSTYSDPAHGVILGRLILFASDGIQAHALPTPSGYPGVPSPYNTADLPGAYTGDTTKLNNFGVPGILLGQVLTPLTGGPSSSNPYYNGLYARFASRPGSSTILGDAIRKQPTFFTFDLGNNDVLGYATTGGASIQLTNTTSFQNYYGLAIGALMAKTTAKGVLTTIPDVTSIPFFLTITWNYVTLDSATAATLKSNLANNYNAFLDGMGPAGYKVLTQAEVDKRKLTYTKGQNAILIKDETLTDLSPYMTGPYAGLAPYAKTRQATANDLIPLSTGGVLGKPGSFGVLGVSEPLDDKYSLIKEEIDSIKTATTAFNNTIKSVAAAYSTRIVVADVNLAFNNLVEQYLTSGGLIEDNVLITPSFAPPFGAFSEDGVHPNSRGYAYLANIIIDAINNNPAVFGAGINVPKANIAQYSGTGLPLTP